MPDDVFTPAGSPVQMIRDVAVNFATPEKAFTPSGNPIQPVRFYSGSGSSGTRFTAGGFPILSVRDVSGGVASPEKVLTDDGQPIQFIKYDDGSLPERPFTPGGNPVQIVQKVDNTGTPIAVVADGDAWAAQVVTNGGTVSAPRLVVVKNFIAAEKASGAWGLTDDYWPLWAENAGQALTSLKQKRLATAVALPAFTIDRGYVFNGTTQYIDTGFIPATHGSVMTIPSCRVALYQRADLTSLNYSAGTMPGAASQGITVRPRTNAGGAISISSGCLAFSNATGAVAGSQGYTAGSRNGLTVNDTALYKNGVSLPVTTLSGGMGIALSTFSFYIGANNAAGTAGAFTASSAGFLALGAALSPAQELAQYNAVQAWATSVGA